MKSYSQAIEILKKSIIKIGNEKIKSSESLNRVTANNIYLKEHYPLSDNSSFDGYAIKSIDTKNLGKSKKRLFKIIGSIAAGDKPNSLKTKKFRTFEVMTGGLIPKGFDTIIPVEKIVFYPYKTKPKYIIIDKKIKKFQHIRFKGSDFKKNDLLIKKGTIIQSNHILALKTFGIQNIKVKKKPKILFFSSGNELTDNKKKPYWKIRNSNSFYIQSIKNNFLFDFTYGGILRDKDEKLFEKKIRKLIKSEVDIIITSGAVSAGKFDFIPNVIDKFDLSYYFKGVAIKPGKPILFAKIKGKQKAIFGLPGNPISSAACFRFFVYPYLRKLLGVENEKPLKATLKKQFVKKKNFTRFLKSKIHTTKDGKIEVEILKGQESFRIQSFLESNIWTLLNSGKSKFKKNEIVDCFFPNHPNNIFHK